MTRKGPKVPWDLCPCPFELSELKTEYDCSEDGIRAERRREERLKSMQTTIAIAPRWTGRSSVKAWAPRLHVVEKVVGQGADRCFGAETFLYVEKKARQPKSPGTNGMLELGHHRPERLQAKAAVTSCLVIVVKPRAAAKS